MTAREEAPRMGDGSFDRFPAVMADDQFPSMVQPAFPYAGPGTVALEDVGTCPHCGSWGVLIGDGKYQCNRFSHWWRDDETHALNVAAVEVSAQVAE